VAETELKEVFGDTYGKLAETVNEMLNEVRDTIVISCSLSACPQRSLSLLRAAGDTLIFKLVGDELAAKMREMT
jgi:hypothetical protein